MELRTSGLCAGHSRSSAPTFTHITSSLSSLCAKSLVLLEQDLSCYATAHRDALCDHNSGHMGEMVQGCTYFCLVVVYSLADSRGDRLLVLPCLNARLVWSNSSKFKEKIEHIIGNLCFLRSFNLKA